MDDSNCNCEVDSSFVLHEGSARWACMKLTLPNGPIDRDCVRVKKGAHAGHLGLVRGQAKLLLPHDPNMTMEEAEAHLKHTPTRCLVYIGDLPCVVDPEDLEWEMPNPLVVVDVQGLSRDEKMAVVADTGNINKLVCSLDAFTKVHLGDSGFMTSRQGHVIAIEVQAKKAP